MLDIRNIVAIAGGAVAIARRSQELGRRPITDRAISKWVNRGTGIPEPNWPLIIELCEGRVSIEDLHRANEAWRAKHLD